MTARAAVPRPSWQCLQALLVLVGALALSSPVALAEADGFVGYGIRVPAMETLLWFSPDIGQAPTAVPGQQSGQGAIAAKGAALTLDRRGDEWVVTRR